MQATGPAGHLPARREGEARSAPTRRVLGLMASGALGLVIGLAGGLSLIAGTTGLNFTHGELVTFGAIATWYLSAKSVGSGLPLVAAAVGGVLSGLFGTRSARVFRTAPRRARGVADGRLDQPRGRLRYVFIVYGASSRCAVQAQSRPSPGPIAAPQDLRHARRAVPSWRSGFSAETLGTRSAVSDNDLSRVGHRRPGDPARVGARRVLAGAGGSCWAPPTGAWNMGQQVLLIMFIDCSSAASAPLRGDGRRPVRRHRVRVDLLAGPDLRSASPSGRWCWSCCSDPRGRVQRADEGGVMLAVNLGRSRRRLRGGRHLVCVYARLDRLNISWLRPAQLQPHRRRSSVPRHGDHGQQRPPGSRDRRDRDRARAAARVADPAAARTTSPSPRSRSRDPAGTGQLIAQDVTGGRSASAASRRWFSINPSEGRYGGARSFNTTRCGR